MLLKDCEIRRDKIPEYFEDDENMHNIMLWNYHRKYGPAFDGPWPEWPAPYFDLIQTLDALASKWKQK